MQTNEQTNKLANDDKSITFLVKVKKKRKKRKEEMRELKKSIKLKTNPNEVQAGRMKRCVRSYSSV